MSGPRTLLAVLAALIFLALGATACSDDGPTSSGSDPGIEVLEQVDDTYRISQDDHLEEFVAAAQGHFTDRYAGASFHRELDDDQQPTGPEILTVHVVDATEADAAWLRQQAITADDRWEDLVVLADAQLSTEGLVEVLRTVMARLADAGATYTVEVDMAGNRVVVDAPDLDPAQRDAIGQGLPEGSVVFADEPGDEDPD